MPRLALRCLGLILVCLLTSAGSVRAQLTREFPWRWKPTESEKHQLLRVGAQEIVPALFLLVDDQGSPMGTAFCVCREHRLLATVAHAVHPNLSKRRLGGAVHAGTGASYSLGRAWVHPDIEAVLAATRGMVIEVGTLTALRMDVAIIQLGTGGPDLPAAVRLMPDSDIPLGLAVGIAGFPLDSVLTKEDLQSPVPIISTGAVHLHGAISPSFEPTPPLVGKMILHTAPLLPGASGSPLFSADGRVIGVAVGSGLVREHGSVGWCMGFSAVDITPSVVYLLAEAEGLEACIAAPLGEPLVGDRIPRAWEQPRWSSEFVNFLNVADDFQRRGMLKEACDALNTAIRVAPDEPLAYRNRGEVLLAYAQQLERRRHADATEYWKLALADFRRAIQCESWQPGRYFDFYTALLAYATARRDSGIMQAVLTFCEEGLRDSPAYEVDCRVLRAKVFIDLGRYSEALQDINAALGTAPYREPYLLTMRIGVYEAMGDSARAAADREHLRRTYRPK